MKPSLDHLPEGKRGLLRAIAAVLQANVEVEMLILFGSYSREGGFSTASLARQHLRDSDPLAVTRKPKTTGARSSTTAP